jgi:hypothetical protein
VILIYFLACSLAISITYRDSNLSLLWLPAGVAIAVIFRYGKVMIPAIFIAILLTELWWKLSIYQAILLAIGSTTGLRRPAGCFIKKFRPALCGAPRCTVVYAVFARRRDDFCDIWHTGFKHSFW